MAADRAIVVLVALALGACGPSAARPGDPSDPPQPVALRVLGCDAGVRVEFRDDVDPTSVTPATFHVENIQGVASYDPAGRAATFRPDTAFEALRREPYVLVAGAQLKSLGGTPMGADLRWSFWCVDFDPPGVVERFPLGDQVATLAHPSARFGEAMDAASLADAMRVAGVQAAASWDPTARTLTLSPERPLYPARTYTATVARTVRDRAGNAMGTDVSWSFRTRPPLDDWAARVVMPPVPRAAPCETSVALRLAPGFDVDVDALADEPPLALDGVRVAAVRWDAPRRLVVLEPESPLRAGASYGAVASGSLRDLRGDTPFDTGASLAVLATVADCAAPAMAEVPDAESELACTAAPTVRFTVPMDAASLATALALRDGAGAGFDPPRTAPLPADVTLSEDGRTATLRPRTALANGHHYQLSVGADARSAAGAPLGTGGAWEITARCP